MTVERKHDEFLGDVNEADGQGHVGIIDARSSAIRNNAHVPALEHV